MDILDEDDEQTNIFVHLYQGKTYKGNLQVQKSFGKCAVTVLHLLDQFSFDKKDLPYHIFFDNLFTAIPLLAELKQRGHNGTGTIRSNRMGEGLHTDEPTSD